MPDLHTIYVICLWIIFVVSGLSFPALFFFTATYGRHAKPEKQLGMPYNLGWFIMELPPLTVVPIVFFYGDYSSELTPLVIFGIWTAHYCYRSLYFPFALKGKGKTKPVMAVAVGFIFNMINGFGIAYGLGHIGDHFTTDWLYDPRFIIGIVLMIVGFSICFHSDRILRNLRKPGETGYKIPYGGFYRWVTSPNYLGEITEWIGFAILLWNLPGLAFMVFTIANLFPRAFSHHKWYKERFPDYPEDRKAIIPLVA